MQVGAGAGRMRGGEAGRRRREHWRALLRALRHSQHALKYEITFPQEVLNLDQKNGND